MTGQSSQPTESADASGHALQCDVAIVGGGLAGSFAAAVLGRAGHDVVLIDRYAEYPPEFRVEKIGGEQIDLLRALKLLDSITAAATTFEQVLNIRGTRIVDRVYSRHLGILYQDLVRVVRAQVPTRVRFVVDRVTELQAGPERQLVRTSNGDTVSARLIVLATGIGDALRHQLGIQRRVVFEKQSITFGFDIACNGTAPPPPMTFYGERTSDRVDYLSLFPIGNVTRANLFTFRNHDDPWIRELRQNPKATLSKIFTGLERYLGEFEITGKVQNWVQDLSVVENHRRDGIVIIGDAFQTSCPAAGTGVSRLLTDVERLCNSYIPQWLASPGMSVEKVSQFYDDPAKAASDARAKYLADYRRALTVETGMSWELHRRKLLLRRRLVNWVDQFNPGWTSRAKKRVLSRRAA